MLVVFFFDIIPLYQAKLGTAVFYYEGISF